MTDQRNTAAPARMSTAGIEAMAREIADQIMHRIGHCGDSIQVYADSIDARAVALRAAQHLYDEGSDVLLSLREQEPQAGVLAVDLSDRVAAISKRSVEARWQSAKALRALSEAAEREWAAAELARTAPAVVAMVEPAPETGSAVALRQEDAASVEAAGIGLARDGAEAA